MQRADTPGIALATWAVCISSRTLHVGATLASDVEHRSHSALRPAGSWLSRLPT